MYLHISIILLINIRIWIVSILLWIHSLMLMLILILILRRVLRMHLLIHHLILNIWIIVAYNISCLDFIMIYNFFFMMNNFCFNFCDNFSWLDHNFLSIARLIDNLLYNNFSCIFMSFFFLILFANNNCYNDNYN